MTSNPHSDRLLWQHPYVNIFKQFRVNDWKKSSKEGDVTSVMDKHLKCTVYKILGSIPAGNYIQFPRTSTQSLGLTGRYLYLLFKPIPTKYFVVHIDTVTEEGLVVRVSFSNLFKEFKSSSTWLQFPFACQAAKGSVEHFTSVGAKSDFMGPAPLSQRWTMLVLDLHYILSIYINKKYSHLKSIRLCANLLVKNCFTSDVSYDPRISIRQARQLGIKSVDENFAPIPREMSFFIPKDKDWDALYDVVRFPVPKQMSSSPRHTPLLPFDSIQRDDGENTNPVLVSRPQSGLGTIRSPKRGKVRNVDLTKRGGLYSTAQENMAVATSASDKRRSKLEVTKDLPPVGVSLLDTTLASCSNPNTSVVESMNGDVHVFAGKSHPDQEIIIHRHFAASNNDNSTVVSTNLATQKSTITRNGKKKTISSARQRSMLIGEVSRNEPDQDTSSLEPDPILKLRKIVGFGGGSHPYLDLRSYRHIALWHPLSSLNGGNDVILYAVHAVVVAMETASGHQHFFIGHTEKVTAIAVNHHKDSPCILASAQGGAGGVVRIWKFETQKCTAIVRSQHATGTNVLAFSATGALLVGVGRDGHGKTLVMVWNVSGALRHGSVSVIAKAHTDVEITRIRVSPTDDTRMVSCGRDNIRFWRVRSNQLRSCPVAMPNEHRLEEISDVTFAPLGLISSKNYNENSQSGAMSVFACTKGGYVIEINFQKVTVRSVHRLYPANSANVSQSDSSKKGLSLNCLRFTSSYVATGSDDGVLRLWPLDLSAVFMEAEHEGPVADLDVTPDGVKVLACTLSATLGYLDVSTRKYSTIMRSHTDVIRDTCMDGLRRTVATCSDDKTIRVWDLESLRQLYDFATPHDVPTVVACHPMLEIFACGFESGAVRVFHVASTSVLSEHPRVHGSKVTSIVFAPTGERLISMCEKGVVSVFDTSSVELVGAPLLRSLPRTAAQGDYGPRALAVSRDGRKVAFIGPNEFTVTVSSSSTLDELLRIDISTGLHLEPDVLALRPKVDSPLRVAFAPNSSNQLLVITRANRLLKLDSKTGKLLSVNEDIHRGNTTCLCASDDGCHLVTAGDKLIKVWDYKMSKDVCFQTFIGHSSPIHRVIFTPDRLSLITCGEDAIFIWDFLGCATPRPPPSESDGLAPVLGRSDAGRSELLAVVRTDESSSDEEETEPRVEPPAPILSNRKDPNDTSWAPPDILRTADLDASDVSEFTLDAKMMEKLALEKDKDSNGKVTERSDQMRRGSDSGEDAAKESARELLKTVDRQNKTLSASLSGSVPVKVAWGSKPDPEVEKLNITMPIAKLNLEEPIVVYPERPNVLAHFSSLPSNSQAALRLYAPAEGQEGLKLDTVIGYNGNGRQNLAWNADTGKLAYTCGCLVVLENLAEGSKKILKNHTEEISCLAMQHDGQILASASGSNGLVQSRICLWDLDTGTCRATLKHHEHDIVALAYSRDDRFLVSVGDYRERSVAVWSAFDGLSSPVILTSTKTITAVHQVVWDPYAPNEFVTVGADATIHFWLLEESGHKVSLNVHDADVPEDLKMDGATEQLVHFTAACYGQEQILHVASNNGVVSVWDTRTNRCFLHWRADSAEICVMKSRGSRLLVAGASRAVRLWSLAGVKEARYDENDDKPGNVCMEDELAFHAEIISGCFDDAMEMGIVGTTSGTVWYLDWNDRSTIRMVSGHKGMINAIAFDEGNYFATCSDEGTVRLWSASSFELAVQFQVMDQSSTCVVFSHPAESSSDGVLPVAQPKMLAAGYNDGTVRVFDVDRLILKLKLQPHAASISALEFAAHNDTLLSGATDGIVAVTSLATGVTLRVLRDHKGAPINSISVSQRTDHPATLVALEGAAGEEMTPEGRLCLICGADRRASVWNTYWKHDVCNMIDWLTFPAPCFAPDGTKVHQNNKKSLKLLPPSCCEFHPSSPDLLIYCGYGMSKCVQMYSLTQKKVVRSITLPNWATCMTPSPDGALLAIGTGSRLLELVDANHGTFQDFAGHGGKVTKVVFSPDGQLLLTVSGGELLVWKMCCHE